MANAINGDPLRNVERELKTAHQIITQAQQKLDNRELNEQLLLEKALDAVNRAQMSLDTAMTGRADVKMGS
jgi:hypothetical protein